MKSRSMSIILAAAIILLALTVALECLAADKTESVVSHSSGILWWSTLYEDLDGGSVRIERAENESNTKPVIKFRAAEIFENLF